MAAKGASVSLSDQAEFLDLLVWRCTMRGGQLPEQACLYITKEEMKILSEISARPHRLSAFEPQIRRVVSGR